MVALRRRVPVLLVAAALLCAGRFALAQEAPKEKRALTPFEIVSANSEKVLGILRSKELAGDEKKPERIRQFREVLADKFDWQAVALHGLGVHWRKRTDKEREAFTLLFRQLLEQIYFKRLTTHAVDANVSYKKEEIKEDRAVVYTMAEKKGVETPIDYLMRKAEVKEGAEAPGLPWLIYDVKVEGVSLLLNYREQFNEIIASGGFETLMEKLKRKVERDEKKL